MVRFPIGTNCLWAVAPSRRTVGGMKASSPRDNATGRRQGGKRRGLVDLLRIPGLPANRQLSLGYELRLRTELAFAHSSDLDGPDADDCYLLDEHYCVLGESAVHPRVSDAAPITYLPRGA